VQTTPPTSRIFELLRQIEKSVPDELDVHLIVDNYCKYKHAKVRAWLTQRERFHIHFTPTYASWINQVERWFGMITERVIRRGSFRSFKELIAKIEMFIANYNRNTTPFAWTATADSIFDKIQRPCLRISGSAPQWIGRTGWTCFLTQGEPS
jgi:putative transposase